ncbi:MAG: flavodoxin-dependent (E)-4-hydroxy-3-methylbut-2-enyl-diphosphate synthase [Candidatus Ratteibacteria bacterium]
MKKKRVVRVGDVFIGGDYPVSVQTMTKVRTSDIQSVLKQIKKIEQTGAEIVRLSVLDKKDAESISFLKKKTKLPLVADIHYDWKLAIDAMESGADKVRINPSNIQKNGIVNIIKEAKKRKIPIRIGLNSGSIKITGRGLVKDIVDAAIDAIKLCQDHDFFDIVISLKTPGVVETIQCYRAIHEMCDYPLHLGITEAGWGDAGLVKNALGIGILLSEGIGNTIRVSLTDSPEKEVKAGQAILQALGLRKFYPEIISCPTCGRCQVPLKEILLTFKNRIMRMLKKYPELKNFTIAIMGCSVNGPGEAKQADIGIAGGKDRFALFARGHIIGTYSTEEIEEAFFNHLIEMIYG